MSSEKDEEWVASPKLKGNSTSDGCIVHCTDASDDLVSIPPMESWKTLLNAATIRHHQAVLDIASNLPDGVVSNIKYHRKCRSTFTMKKLVESIKKKQVHVSNKSSRHNFLQNR